MTEVTVSEAIARPIRGAGQGSAAWIVTEAIEAFGLYNFTERQYGLSVLILGVVFSFIQNVIENKLGKGFLRSVPPTTVPVLSDKDDDGLDPVPTPVNTDNGPRPEDGPQDEVSQDPDVVYEAPEDNSDVVEEGA